LVFDNPLWIESRKRRRMNLPPPQASTRQGSLQRLTERAALWFEREACLAVRFPYAGCDRCARACPVEVLTLSGDGPELTEGCLNCGRCVAACPSDALRMPGSEPKPPADEGIAVRIDCWRVPEALSTPDTIRLPCLGALKVSRLLHLARTGPVSIMDRGWCADCPAGGDRHPASEAMAEANRLLGGTEPAIRIEQRPLPQQVAAVGIPHPLDQRPTGRRGFLRHLAGEAVAIRLPEVTSSAAPPHDGNRRIEPAEQLARLAAFPDDPPAALLPTLTLGDDCCNHNVCARLCPTGALQVYEQNDHAGIRFDARRCIACEACLRGCPEQALSLESGGGSPTPVTLSRHRLRECFECSRPFATPPFASWPGAATDSEPDEDALPVCPACSKSRRLIRAGFDELFKGERRC
jgi:ferredoxin